jgi:glycosyltransferase involved in cell wall biosynthesis
MLTVAFDNQTVLAERYGGVARYFVELAAGLTKLPEVRPVYCAGLYRNCDLRTNRHRFETRGYWVPGVYRKLKMHKLSDALCARQMRQLKPDIIHETNYSHNPPGLDIPARRVLTVYDMIHEKFMPDSPTPALKRAALARADWILCISETTRRDLLEYYPQVASRTSVTYLAGPEPSGPLPRPRMLPEPYILFVGNRAGYKNFAGLVRAYAQDRPLQQQVRLAVYGGKPWFAEEMAELVCSGISHRVTIVPDTQNRAALYQHAEAFVFPSLYEGFGLPLLEAIAEGCPVVCSDTPCFREVMGDSAAYFDPVNSVALASAVRQIIACPNNRKPSTKLSNRYAWADCALRSLSVYKEVSS